jgi:hypothetical protein
MLPGSQARIVVRTATLAGALLVVVPLLNLVNTWPLNPSSASWRFGAFGLLANTLLLPVIGALLLTAAAAWVSGRRRLWTLALLSGGATVGLLVFLGLFALDALQQRSEVVNLQASGAVREGGLLNFDLNVAKAALQGMAAMVAFGLMSLAAWRGARAASARQAAEKSSDESMLVVGKPTTSGGG